MKKKSIKIYKAPNQHQLMFKEMAFERMKSIESILNSEIPGPHIRLLYYKEMYSVFSELSCFAYDTQTLLGKLSESESCILKDLENTVKFIRRILSHFPLFETWDDIWISKEFSDAMYAGPGKSTISTYLTENEQRIPFKFRIKPIGSTKQVIAINYPKGKTNEDKIFLKDIINENEGATSILAMMNYFYKPFLNVD